MAGGQGQSGQLRRTFDNKRISGAELPALRGYPFCPPEAQKFFVGLGDHGNEPAWVFSNAIARKRSCLGRSEAEPEVRKDRAKEKGKRTGSDPQWARRATEPSEFLLGKRCTAAATPPVATNHMSMTTVGPPI